MSTILQRILDRVTHLYTFFKIYKTLHWQRHSARTP